MAYAATRILVPFEGEGHGVDEMSWGQREIWTSMVRCESAKPVGGVKPLLSGTTIEDIAEELRYLMSRYQVMRTRLQKQSGGWPCQAVSDRGVIVLDIVDVDGDGADPARAAEELCERYRNDPFDHERDWPVRMGVIRDRGTLTHMAVIMSHLAMDGFSGSVMMREVAAHTSAPVTGLQPLEQARWQRSDAGQRQNAAALRYWKHLLNTMDPPWWGHSDDRRSPRHWEGVFDSPALLLASRLLTRATGSDSATILLTAFVTAMARITGVNPVAIRPMASNRFRSGLVETVSPVCQAGLCVLDVADVPFDEALRRVRQATMAAYKHAYVDPAGVQELIKAAVHDRGPAFDLDCFFNDRRIGTRHETLEQAPDEHEIREALARSAFRWVAASDAPSSRLYVQVDDVPGMIRLNIFADTHHLSPACAEALVREVETVVIAEALAGAIDHRPRQLGRV